MLIKEDTVELLGLEFAGKETMLEGAGISGLPAWATSGGRNG
jgi:hypothetical protein